jgi:pimeloyl-ACP methyl ester carboxylesterase
MSTALLHHTVTQGREPTVVLIHGMACDESDWQLQVSHLRAHGQQVVTVDLRGHGQSMHFSDHFDMTTMGADVAALLRHIQVKQAVVVGHSMGCRVATETALHAPEIVSGVALIDGSRFASSDVDAAVSATRNSIAARGWRAHMEATFESMFVAGTDATLRARIIARACARPEQIGIPIMLSMVCWDAARFDSSYAAINVPVQVLQSSHVNAARERVGMTADMEIPWHADLLAHGIDVTIERVENCGHFTMLDAPGRVNAAIEALLHKLR